jgi:bifunctional UDP-N-acetylglucosamine pyrophosphorylase/glucosamine-1-phosphate N-acetyltransferase
LNYSAVVLAAGKGVRMKSEMPKVVHKAAGKPLVHHVIDAVKQAGIDKITIVIGNGREMVKKCLENYQVNFAIQDEQLGTGHALKQTRNFVCKDGNILVVAGDTPLLRGTTLEKLTRMHEESGATATVLSCELSNPYGYGRIVRDKDGSFNKIVEEKDAGEQEKKIQEINSGIYCFRTPDVFEALEQLNTDNAQGEYYLTDVLEIFLKKRKKIEVFLSGDAEEIYGVNGREQLAAAEHLLRQRKNKELMSDGVTLINPDSIFVDIGVTIGHDTIIMPYTIIEGQTSIGKACRIGPSCHITDSIIGPEVNIATSTLEQAEVAAGCKIGPYAYLRPGTVLKENVKVGDFVEIKKSLVGPGSKIPHLSYVGDAAIGKKVNIGAGTITCNYDGKNKYQTVIEDGVFIGSNTNLIAPVIVGKNSTIGAGSSISKDVPPNTLAVERAEQKNIKRRDKN